MLILIPLSGGWRNRPPDGLKSPQTTHSGPWVIPSKSGVYASVNVLLATRFDDQIYIYSVFNGTPNFKSIKLASWHSFHQLLTLKYQWY